MNIHDTKMGRAVTRLLTRLTDYWVRRAAREVRRMESLLAETKAEIKAEQARTQDPE